MIDEIDESSANEVECLDRALRQRHGYTRCWSQSYKSIPHLP